MLSGSQPCAAVAHPRVVVEVIEDGRLAGRGIDRREPALGVVGGAHRRDTRCCRRATARRCPIARRASAPGSGFGAGRGSSPTGGFGIAIGSLTPSRPAHTASPVSRFSTARRRRSWASPTLVRAWISSVNADSLTKRGTCAVRDCARSLTTRNANLPSPDTRRVGDGLPFGELELRQRARLVERFAALAARGFLLDPVEDLRLFLLDELLAVGDPRIGSARGHVGQLHDAAGADALDRHDEQVVVAHEGHVRLAARPAGARLVPRRPRHVDAPARHRVDDDDVAAIDAENAAALCVPLAVGQRRHPPLDLAEALRRAAVPADDPGRRLSSFGISHSK